jgi:deazaflavin-dependent oxidoreductase (nitroreductase family)
MSVVVMLQRGFLKVHQGLYEVSGGLVGHRMIGVPTLLLRTTGRKSGATRTSALVYAKDVDAFVVTASNGGDDRPPGWLLNVEAKPEVEIQIGRTRKPATARLVEKGDADYPRLWEVVNRVNHGRYAGYQKRTSRPITLVALTPR